LLERLLALILFYRADLPIIRETSRWPFLGRVERSRFTIDSPLGIPGMNNYRLDLQRMLVLVERFCLRGRMPPLLGRNAQARHRVTAHFVIGMIGPCQNALVIITHYLKPQCFSLKNIVTHDCLLYNGL